jgi:CheY-specific phosphatase CheX
MTLRPQLDAEQAKTVRALTTEACAEMFALLGTPVDVLERGHTVPATHTMTGFIGFSGPIRGSLTVSSTADLFRASYPSKGEPNIADLLDWVGEIANQLLGRIKRRFCERGVDFEASTPAAIRGRDIGGRSPVREGVCDLVFRVGSDVVGVSFEVTPAADGKIFTDTAEPIGCSREGDLVLF